MPAIPDSAILGPVKIFSPAGSGGLPHLSGSHKGYHRGGGLTLLPGHPPNQNVTSYLLAIETKQETHP